MIELSAIQKLDVILNFFATNSNVYPNLHLAVISNLLMVEGYNFEEKDLVIMLNKLVKDEYITNVFAHTDVGIDVYVFLITFEGMIFYEQGGYEQHILKQNAENIRVETLASYQREQADTLNRVTWWIAGATIVAALGGFVAAWYYGVELWKYFHPN